MNPCLRDVVTETQLYTQTDEAALNAAKGTGDWNFGSYP